MKSIYNITKAQFITIWIFAIIGSIAFGGLAEQGSDIGAVLFWAIPFFLIFYSLGYRNYKK